MKETQKKKAAGLLLIASFLWGSSFVGSKICLNAGLFPFETVFYRMVIGTALIVVVYYRQLRHFARRSLIVGILLGLITSAVYTFEMYGISMTETTKASFLTSTSIVMMPFLFALFFHTRPRFRSVLAALIAMAGVCLLSGGSYGFSLALGDILLLFTAFLYAMNSITVAKLGMNVSSVQVTFLQLLITTVYTGIMTLIQGRCGNYPQEAVGALLFLAIGPTLICYLIKNYAVQRLTPVQCTLISATEGIFCALLSVVLLHEHVTVQMCIAILLILAGILTEQLGEVAWKRMVKSHYPKSVN